MSNYILIYRSKNQAASLRARAVDGRAPCGLGPHESHVLAFVQQMRTGRHDAIAGYEIADDRSRFAAEAGDLHGPPGDPRRFAFDQPYAGTLARIENRADRYLQRGRGPAVRYLDGDGRAERRLGHAAL